MDQSEFKTSFPSRKPRRLKKGRMVALLACIVFFAGLAYAFLSGSSPTTLVTSLFTKEKLNILVLGVDSRDDDVGRSDTTFVISIDTIAKKITMLSIPRDSRVKIAGHGWDKINHAYAFGGSKLSKSSVEHLLGISMDYTVVINVQGFVHMIDALGGITIDVDKRMYYSDPYDDDGGLYIDLRPGVQKLTGKHAIEYVRFRDEEGDIGRVTRQQKFLKAVLQEIAKPQVITKLPDLIKEFAKTVKTDMPTKEIIALIPLISDAAKSGLQTESLPGTPAMIQDISYWLPNIRDVRAKVAMMQGITIDSRYSQATDSLASEYASSVPRESKIIPSSTVAQHSVTADKKTVDPIKPTTTATKNPEPSKGKSENTTPVKITNITDSQTGKNATNQTKESSGSTAESTPKNSTATSSTKP